MGLIGAVDIGGTKILVGVVDEMGKVVTYDSFNTITGNGGAQKSSEWIVKSFQRQCEQNNFALEELKGIGLVCAGPVDWAKGIVENPFTLPGWDGFPLVDYIQDRLRVPSFLDNDCNGMLLGEIAKNHLEDERVLMISFGTGIGVAAWIDGQLYRTNSKFHPEMGHIIVDGEGPECYCHHNGCFESLCSGSAINKRAVTLGYDDFDQVYIRANDGDVKARKFLDQLKHQYKNGMWTLMSIFNPSVVVLGGGVMVQYFDFINRIMLEDLSDMLDFVDCFRVIQASDHGLSALSGARQLVLNN